MVTSQIFIQVPPLSLFYVKCKGEVWVRVSTDAISKSRGARVRSLVACYISLLLLLGFCPFLYLSYNPNWCGSIKIPD